MYNDDIERILDMGDKDFTNAIAGLRQVAERNNNGGMTNREQAVSGLVRLARNEAPPRNTTALGNAARGGR